MSIQYKELAFRESTPNNFQFDFVYLENILNKNFSNHNQFEYHKLSFYGIFLCTENKGTYNHNFKDYAIKKQTLFTLRKGNTHKFYKTNAKGILLIFTENFIIQNAIKEDASKVMLLFNEMLLSPKLDLSTEAYTEISSLIRIIEQEYFNRKDDFSLRIIRSILQAIIAKLFRLKSLEKQISSHKKYTDLFLKYYTMVELEHINSKKVGYFASKLGVSTKTLNNATQSVVKKTAK